MSSNRRMQLLPLVFVFFSTLSVTALPGDWTTLDVPGATNTFALGVSGESTYVVGYYLDAIQAHAFVWSGSDGQFSTFDVPNSTFTQAWGVSTDGRIVGIYESSDKKLHGFLLASQMFTTIDFPGAEATEAAGINDDGTVVGTYTDSQKQRHGFKWVNGSFSALSKVPVTTGTTINWINQRGDITGVYQDAKAVSRAFILTAGGTFRKLSFQNVGNVAINFHRVIVGTLLPADGFKYIVHKKEFVEIHFPHSQGTYCYGINDRPAFVGFYKKGKAYHGFIK